MLQSNPHRLLPLLQQPLPSLRGVHELHRPPWVDGTTTVLQHSVHSLQYDLVGWPCGGRTSNRQQYRIVGLLVQYLECLPWPCQQRIQIRWSLQFLCLHLHQHKPSRLRWPSSRRWFQQSPHGGGTYRMALDHRSLHHRQHLRVHPQHGFPLHEYAT